MTKPRHIVNTVDFGRLEARLLLMMTNRPNQPKLPHPDIHESMAMDMFEVPLEGVTPEMRRKAKAANFGLAYGGSVGDLFCTIAGKTVTGRYTFNPPITYFNIGSPWEPALVYTNEEGERVVQFQEMVPDAFGHLHPCNFIAGIIY